MLGSLHSLGRQGVGCVGVRAGRLEGEVVCSLTKGTIETYNVHDNWCVHSWSLQSSDRITCPCIYHTPSKRYCTIRNGNEFLCWLEDADSVEGSTCSLPSHPHTLLPSPSLPHVAIVYNNGSVCLLDVGAVSLVEGEAMSLVGRVTRRTGKLQLGGASLVCCGGMEWVVLVYSQAGQSCVGTCIVRGEGLGSPHTSRLQPEMHTQVELVSWCMCKENLIALWSNGSLTTTTLLPLLSVNNDAPSTLSSHWHTSLPSPPRTALLASVSTEYFAMWESGVLSLWDARYTTCQARTASHTTKPLQLSCVGGSLCAVGGEGVEVCRVQCERGGVLASALGRRTGSSTSPLLVTPAWVEPEMDCGEWESETKSRNEVEREVISSLLDNSKTPNLDSFTAVFDSLHLCPGLWCGEVVRRVLNEESFWAREPLTRLLEAHLCPPSLCGELLGIASERNDWSLVAVALRCVEGVPEPVLVGLLQQALSLPEVTECYGSSVQRDELLYLLLSHPRNDTMIQQPLSQMPFPLVMSLLQFLSRQVAMEALLAPSPPLLSYNAVLEWTGLLLDVHFTQLAMVPEARQLLTSLHSRVSKQVLFLTRLSPLQGLAQTPPTPPRQHWLYRVEKLDINV